MHINETVLVALISGGAAALVSAAFTFWGQHLERSHQKRKTLFETALAASQRRIEFGVELVKLTGKQAEVPDQVLLAGTYYRWLSELYEKGVLPKEALEAEEKSQRDLDAAKRDRENRRQLEIERRVTEAARHPLAARQLLAASDLSVFSEEQLARLQKGASVSYP